MSVEEKSNDPKENKRPDLDWITGVIYIAGVILVVFGLFTLAAGFHWEDLDFTPKGKSQDDEVNLLVVMIGFICVTYAFLMFIVGYVIQILSDMRFYLKGIHDK